LIALPSALYQALVDHAREAAPHEACGVVGVHGDRIERLERARNASTRPQVHFTFADDGYLTIIAVERAGLEPGIYHSHPASAAYPSATDRAEMSGTWPDSLQLMVSLRHGPDSPEVNAYRIDAQGEVTQLELSIVD
jgi:proteasome lid subunit RPN8/RPN11